MFLRAPLLLGNVSHFHFMMQDNSPSPQSTALLSEKNLYLNVPNDLSEFNPKNRFVYKRRTMVVCAEETILETA